MKNIAFLIVLFFWTPQVFSQHKIDSLENALLRQTVKEEKIQTQIVLAEEYLNLDLISSRLVLDAISSQLNIIKSDNLLIQYYLVECDYARFNDNINEGKKYANLALELANINKDSIFYKSKIYHSLGSLNDDESKVDLAMSNHLKALRYAEMNGDSSQIASISAGIGRTYLFLEEFENAKKHYEKAIRIKKSINENDLLLGNYYTNLSSCYDAEGLYDKSLEFLDKSIFLKKKYKSLISLSSSYNNKAYTLFLMKRFREAERNVIVSLAYSDSIQSETDKMFAYSTYSEILFVQNRFNLAENYMNKSIELSKKNKDLYLAKYNLDLMCNIYVQKGDYKKALDFYEQRSIIIDSIYNVRSRGEVEKLVVEFETEKKNKAIELLNAEKKINEIELKKSNQLQLAFLIVSILAITIMLLLYSQHKNKIKTNKILKEAMERDFKMKLADSEMQALRAQMNPHFLFNCLNSINSFIIKNEQEKASEYLAKFSKLIRQVLNNSKEAKVTLGNELETLKLYIELEALRFSNKFKYKIKVHQDVEVDYLEIPPLIIQPYVENSIWHGLLHKKGGEGNLLIEVSQNGNMLTVTIEDNGIGRKAASKMNSKSAEKRKSYGMNITKERLENTTKNGRKTSNVEVFDIKDENNTGIGTRVILNMGV